jgi:hypothetical protein
MENVRLLSAEMTTSASAFVLNISCKLSKNGRMKVEIRSSLPNNNI